MDEHEIIRFELDKEDAPDIIDVLRKIKEDTDKSIIHKQADLQALISKSARIGLQLEKLTGVSHVDETLVGKSRPVPRQINGYKTNWSVWDKVKYILKKEIEPVTKRQIIEKIEAFDSPVASLIGKKKRQFSVSVSSCLTTKFSKGQLVREAEEGKEHKYRLPNLAEL